MLPEKRLKFAFLPEADRSVKVKQCKETTTSLIRKQEPLPIG
jgi:hypothetical protein